MNTIDPIALARVIVEDRIREANRQHLARQFRRPARSSTARTVVQTPQRHSRLWSLVHFGHAYS
jgi:hypothetical protein